MQTERASQEAFRVEPPPVGQRPWWSRVSGARLMMVVAGVLAFLLNLVLLRGHDDGIAVAVAAANLAAGSRLDAADISAARLDQGDDLVRGLIPIEDFLRFEGMILAVPVRSGDPLTPSLLRDSAAPHGLRAVSVPVDRQHAAGGSIQPGDRVDVITVSDGVARYVVYGAEVLGVPSGERSGIAGQGPFYVVLAADADQALELILAMRTGTVDVVRSTGAAVPNRLNTDSATEGR